MTDPNFILLYVTDVARSAAFWSSLLGRPPIEQSPTFAMLPLREGVMLGLWRRDGVEPTATATGGGAEIAITAPDAATVDTIHAAWSARGVAILQTPTAMDFGHTFTAADPDGHRIRVFAPAG